MSLNGKLSKSVIDGHPPGSCCFPLLFGISGRVGTIVFNGKPQNPRLAAEITNQAMEFMYCYSSLRISNGSATKMVQWEEPLRSWAKLNIDRASLGNLDLAGCGGVVWDENGNWVAEFSRRIGITSSFMMPN